VQSQSATYRSDLRQHEELVLRLVRPAGAGLGISVAGGIGSTPYRANDQVHTPWAIKKEPTVCLSLCEKLTDFNAVFTVKFRPMLHEPVSGIGK